MFNGILVLMRSRLYENNLNNSLSKGSLVTLLLLASSTTPSSCCFNICGYHFFVNQCNVPKTFIMIFGMLHNVASSFTSVFFCTSLGDPNCVDCWVSSLGEPIGFSTIV